MPIHEYRCDACEHQFENRQKMSDPLLSECPQCGKPQLKKLISAGSFQMKQKAAAAPQCGMGVCPGCPGSQ